MKYLKLEYILSFLDIPQWGNPPAFVFRSILGFNLRKLTCVLRQQKTCNDCMVKESCVYSVFFETNVNKNLVSLSGRDKASHPFVLDIETLDLNTASLEITFIGRAINYIPYINLALENAGKNGIGKSRTRFEIKQIKANGDDFSPNISKIKEYSNIWPVCPTKTPKALILETPCRIKEQGRYISEIDLDVLLKSIQRRMLVLEELFGDGEELPSLEIENNIQSKPLSQTWQEKSYYSSRQKTVMRLGGVVGMIEIENRLEPAVVSYIDAMEIFHVGKNISFGFGKVKVVY